MIEFIIQVDPDAKNASKNQEPYCVNPNISWTGEYTNIDKNQPQ
jgi:hypothetical protein